MNRFSVFSDHKLGELYYYAKHKSGLDVFVFPKQMKLKTALATLANITKSVRKNTNESNLITARIGNSK